MVLNSQNNSDFHSKTPKIMRTRNESVTTTGAFVLVIFGFILYVVVAVVGVLEVVFRYYTNV